MCFTAKTWAEKLLGEAQRGETAVIGPNRWWSIFILISPLLSRLSDSWRVEARVLNGNFKVDCTLMMMGSTSRFLVRISAGFFLCGSAWSACESSRFLPLSKNLHVRSNRDS